MTASFAERLLQRTVFAGIKLTPLELMRIEQYYFLLERWNQKVNLTALPLSGLPDQTIDRLLIEPLIAARVVPDAPLTWFDLGSGGGSPAIPLKVMRPMARLTMVESRSRKAAFLREAVRTLELADTTVTAARVEKLESAAAGADLITVRAVRVDATLEKTCSALLSSGGKLLLFASSAGPPATPAGFRASQALELAPNGSILYTFARLG